MLSMKQLSKLKINRIGLIIPSSNIAMEDEFYKYLPSYITMHTARMKLKSITEEGLIEMEKEIDRCIDLLMDCRINVLVFGCTSGSLIKGKEYDKFIKNKIENISSKPAIVTATCAIKALNSLDLKRISVFTPYSDKLNTKVKCFLESYGFKVINIKGLNLTKRGDPGKVDPKFIYQEARKLKDGDGLFISCTGLRTFNILKILEDELGKPVVSSNQATLWATLRKLGFMKNIKELGSLFSK